MEQENRLTNGQTISCMDLLRQAEPLLKAGKKDEAHQILVRVLQIEPQNAMAWYGLAYCIDTLPEKKDCLRRAIAGNPNYSPAIQALQRLEAPTSTLVPDLLSTQATPKPVVPNPTPPELYPHAESQEIQPKRKKAGESTYEMADQRWKSMWWILGIGIGVILILYLLIVNSNLLGVSGVGILVLVILIKFVSDFVDVKTDKKSKEYRRAKRGARAEEKIGDLLGALGNDYEVLHDVVCAYGNIDHIVISKDRGVFMIETKSHGGRITSQGDKLLLNGHDPEKDFIAQSLRNSFWLRDKIEPVVGSKPWITQILVFTNAFVQSGKPIKGVIVTNKKYLLSTILKRGSQNMLNGQIWEKRSEILLLLS